MKIKWLRGFSLGLFSISTLAMSAKGFENQPIKTETGYVSLEVVASGLKVPWGLEFLPDGRALVGEREAGRLSVYDFNSGGKHPVSGLPEMLRNDKISAGLFDIRLHPEFESNNKVYLVHAIGQPEANGLALSIGTLQNNRLTQVEQLFETKPKTAGKWHFGGRLIVKDKYLYLSTGDGYEFTTLSQDLTSHSGKILRLNLDGKAPETNPFVGQGEALPEIWSLGVRNPQAMALTPDSKQVWQVEHGPQGGDEINRVEKGKNYGWPVITYGEQYGGGPIGDGITHKEGMEHPLYYWTPSIAPSGATFYGADSYPGWQGNLFVGALAKRHLNRLVIENSRVIHEERLFEDKNWRVRVVRQGPDGYLYFAVDDGHIIRIVPSKPPEEKPPEEKAH